MRASEDSAIELQAKLESVWPNAALVAVAADKFRGFRIEIVASEFKTEPVVARFAKLWENVDEKDVAHASLLTPLERDLLNEEEGGAESRPTWPDSLSLSESQAEIEVDGFAESLDGLEPPVVVTFYSLRGGVGRSTALAHTARQLVDQGLRVLCVDMDFEAPGLAALLGVEDRVSDSQGVVSLLLRAEITGAMADLYDHVIDVDSGGRLQIIPAGKIGADYARKLSLLNPSAWYREDSNPLHLLMDEIRGLPRDLRPDVVLIDSRTGISPIAAPLMFDVSDMTIVAFYPHPQARRGTELLTRALLNAKSRRLHGAERRTPEIRFIASPVPAHPEIRSVYEARVLDWVAEWLKPAVSENGDKVFEVLEDLVQVISYQEPIAASDDARSIDSPSDFAVVAAWIAGLVSPPGAELSTGSGVPDSEPTKTEILASLNFDIASADSLSSDELAASFVSTGSVRESLQEDRLIVIGRKGTGKTAIFRSLAMRPGALVITSPPSSKDTFRPWMPAADIYKPIELFLRDNGLGWQSAWLGIIALGIIQYMPSVDQPEWVRGPLGRATKTYRGSDLKNDLFELLSPSDAALKLREWLIDVGADLNSVHTLLFDALDTGFGPEAEDRVRRNEAVTGLLATVYEVGPQLGNLKFKVLLREDIWTDVIFPNKSHLRASAARLEWKTQTDYLRVALKQALRSEDFRNLLEARLASEGFDAENRIEFWRDELVRQAWILLVGERMSGGRTAYTDNWVWMRLADGNGDRAPRALVQLLGEATRLERSYEQANAYPKAVIRPRALVESLDEVSDQALSALLEEFKELEPLLERLRVIGVTPFDSHELDDATVEAHLISLAQEVGVLELVAATATSAARYRVPEIYRKGLNMGRKGQA